MSKRKIIIDKKTKPNGYVYELDHPHHQFKVNLKTNTANWGISFTIDGNEVRKSSFGTIKPNSNHDTFNRMREWESIIYSIIELYVNDYDNLLLALDNTINPINEKTMYDVAQDYLHYIDLTKKDTTYNKYKGSAKHFIDQYGKYTITEFSKIKREQVIEYVRFILDIKGFGNKQRNEIVACMSRIVIFLNAKYNHYGLPGKINNHFEFDNYELVKLDQKNTSLNKAYSLEDYTKMKNLISFNPGKFLMFEVFWDTLYYTHLRIDELNNLQVKDIDFENMMLRMDSDKYKTDSRFSYLPKNLITLIKHHLSLKGITASEAKDHYIFGQMGQWLTPNKPCNATYLSDKFRDIRSILDLDKNYTLYSIKHFANVQKYNQMTKDNMLWNDILNILADYNGHTDTRTTEIYLRDKCGLKKPELERKQKELGHNPLGEKDYLLYV